MAISARIEELERKFNENPRRYFAPLANEYRKAGDLTQAISICRTYVPQQPAHMSGHIVFGQALFEAGEFEEARSIFESALQLDPENLIALRHLGDIARERGEITAARTWYRRVLDADPRNGEVSGLLSALDGVPDQPAAAAQSHAADVLGSWHDINPERTLELPPALAQAVSQFTEPVPPALAEPDPHFAEPAPYTPSPAEASEAAPADPGSPFAEAAPPRDEPAPAAPAEPEVGAAASPMGMEGFYSAEHDTEALHAAEAPPAGNDLGLEVMEFVPPPRAERTPVDAAASDTPSAFVTETMAELYLQQGFREEALAVYRQLLAQNPDDVNLRDRVDQLASGSRSSVSVAAVADSVIDAAHQRRNAPQVRSVRAFFGALAARRVGHAPSPFDAPPPAEESADTPYPHASAAPHMSGDPHASDPHAHDAHASDPHASDPHAHDAHDPHDPHDAHASDAHTETTDPAPPPDPVDAAPPPVAVAESETPPPHASAPSTGPLAEDTASPSGATSLLDGSYFSSGDSYSDEAFAEDSFGANAFTGAFGGAAAAGGALIGAEDFGGESLVSRKTEEVDAFGLPIRREHDADHTDTAAPPPPAEPETPSVDAPTATAAAPAVAADDTPAVPDADHATVAGAEPVAAPADSQTGSVDGLFADASVAAADEAAASTLSGAFGGPMPASDPEHAPSAPSAPSAPERTVRPASNELSLDSVFRENPGNDSRRESSAFSFDQFFGSESVTGSDPATPSTQDDAADDVGGLETEQFSSWLSGLKKK